MTGPEKARVSRAEDRYGSPMLAAAMFAGPTANPGRNEHGNHSTLENSPAFKLLCVFHIGGEMQGDNHLFWK